MMTDVSRPPEYVIKTLSFDIFARFQGGEEVLLFYT